MGSQVIINYGISLLKEAKKSTENTEKLDHAMMMLPKMIEGLGETSKLHFWLRAKLQYSGWLLKSQFLHFFPATRLGRNPMASARAFAILL